MKTLIIFIALSLLLPVSSWAGKKPEKKCDKSFFERLPLNQETGRLDIDPQKVAPECYCVAVNRKYVNYQTASPTLSLPDYFTMSDREFRCFFPKAPTKTLNWKERKKVVVEKHGKFSDHLIPESVKALDK